MLIRIVRMEFHLETIEPFMKLFQSIQQHISSFPGCEELELHRDSENLHVLYTRSVWINSGALENYRKSSFFKEVWPQAKQYFAGKPQAFSLLPISQVSPKKEKE
ncbi:MAG: antibiotic biosynthesis monooxygenase [Bacteroidota bacterium]